MFEPQDLPPYWTELPRTHPYRQEMERWNRPYRFEQFPQMVYRARKRPDGVVAVIETRDSLCAEKGEAVSPGRAEQWSRGNYMTVGNTDDPEKNHAEFQRAMEAGWRPTIAEAMALYEAKEKAIADAAAHRHHEDRNMSAKAKAEAAAIEGDSSEHTPEIPVAPVRKKPGPKPRTQPDAA